MKNIVTSTIGTGLNLLSHIAPVKTGEIGFQLFCYPKRPKLTDKHRKFLAGGQWRKLPAGKEQVQLYKWGNGSKSVFFAHGWQSHTYRWKPYIHSLDPEEYTAYALDAPGHGLSSGNFLSLPLYGEVIAAMQKLTGPVDIMVGHSMGSFGLLYSASHHEVMPKGMVLLAPPSNANDFFEFYQSVLQLSDRTVNLTIDYFINHFDKTPDYYSASKFAGSLEVPGLIIHDETDTETPVSNAREIHAAWPSSRLIETSGYGHNLRSADVVHMVTDFVEAHT